MHGFNNVSLNDTKKLDIQSSHFGAKLPHQKKARTVLMKDFSGPVSFEKSAM